MASSKAHRHRTLSLIISRQLSVESSVDKENFNPSSRLSSPTLQVGSFIDNVMNSDDDDDDDDLNDSISVAENYRFAPQFIRNRRYSSNYSTAHQQRVSAFRKPNLGVISDTRTRTNTDPTIPDTSYPNLRGQTLLHLAARLGHDEILRLLISETSQAGILMDHQGQTSLLTAIKAGCTSTATLLMQSDPRSIIISDNHRSSVFHYACEYCNDVILNRAITLLKRLNSSSDRITGLRRVMERNDQGKTPFDIAIEKGQLKCVKQFLLSSWLETNLDIRELINANSLKLAIDQDQFDILSFFVTDIKRFSYIIHLLIDIHGQYFNLLEYAIYLKKVNIIRLLISVRIPFEEFSFHQQYKSFLQHYNQSCHQLNVVSFYQTPLQRMLTIPECISLVPLLLEQFIDRNGIDLSIIDDSLYARPGKTRCIFGQTNTDFSTTNWLEQHPLSINLLIDLFPMKLNYKYLALIANADSKPIYDHPLVRMCVDLKFHLFGNFLFLVILCCQSIYVALYTGIALSSPTPAEQGMNYYQMSNYSCLDLCLTLANMPIDPARNQVVIRVFRFSLLIISGLALLKEFYQIFTQREKYFRRFYINIIELHMYISAIIYSVDINECTRQTGIRCATQWMTGAIGLLSVWTSLLLFVMNGIQFGKYGLLFITVSRTFLKFLAVYIFIWIGYILAFYMLCKDILDQFRFFNFIPKLLVMFIGEYDMDSTFFSNNNQLMPGAEGALILYSAYIFTMFIVMTNIMGGLAVADVKEFRLNAKREHLRSRIGVVLSFQAYLGALCETISSINIRLAKNAKWLEFLSKFNLIPIQYQLQKLEIRSRSVRIPRDHSPSEFDEIYPETGFYVHRQTIQNDSLFEHDENIRLSKKIDEIRDVFEESTIRVNNQLRKIAFNLQTELEDIKRRLFR